MTSKKYLSDSPKLTELRQQKNNNFKKKIIISLIIFLLIIVGLIFLSNWKEINIQTINVSGNKIVESSEIEKIVKDTIDDKYFYIIPKTNGLLFPKNQIITNIKEKHKRISSVKLETKDFQNLEIILTENKGIYTWCGETPFVELKETEEICYFMDEYGYVFDIAPKFSGNVYLKFYGDIKKNNNNPIGFYYMPRYFENLKKFNQALQDMNFQISAFYTKDDFETIVYLNTNKIEENSAKIILKTNDDPIKIAENLQASISNEPLKSKLEKAYFSLLYIDLRYDNKVYYKFK